MTIGDGKHPRAGILFVLATKWIVKSIDPIMDNQWQKPLLENLECMQMKDIDAINQIDFENYQIVLIIGVHSHADLYESKRQIQMKTNAKIIMLYIPCCKGIPRQLRNHKPIIDKLDDAIPSSKNRVLVWKFGFETK